MKYKTLVIGKNTTIIDDFFVQMGDNFEVISSSTRLGDIMRHIKYFAPELLVYCLSNEARESISQMVNIKSSLLRSRIPVVILGSREECDEFEKIAVNVATLTLTKPFTAVSIQESIVKFMEERQALLDEIAATQEKGKDAEAIQRIATRRAQENAERNSQLDAKDALQEAFRTVVAQLEEMSTEEAAPEPVEPEVSEDAEDFSSRKHILIIDDAPLMLRMLKEQLHDDYDVATAVSGKIAMKFLERKKPHLILLDYEMPGESGPEVLEKLRANDATKDIPVVFLTGVSDKDKIQEALALKPQSYLLKPVDREKLIEAITKIIG